jgi:hypothetical protein
VLIASKPYEGALLRRVLEAAAGRVLLADPAAAPETAERERPEVVVIAVRRGQEEECTRTIAALSRLTPTPRVLLVVDAGTVLATLDVARAIGAAGIVVRPVDPAAIVAGLKEALAATPPSPQPVEPEPAPPPSGEGSEPPPRQNPALEIPTAKVSRGTRQTGPQLPAVQARMLTGPQLPVARPTGPLLAVETLRMLADDLAELRDPPPPRPSSPLPQASASEPGSLADPARAAPAPAALSARSGSLSTNDLPRLLEQAARTELTGRLTVQREDAVKTIIFDAGAPVFATSNQPYDRLGDLLYREGKLSWEQYVQCQDIVVESGRRIGAVLVDRGLIKPRELFPLVRRQVEEIIYSLFAWWEGNYVIGFGEPAADERIRLETHVSALIVEGIRRKYGLDRLIELVGPPETQLLAIAAAEQRLARAGLSDAERAALKAMDGQLTLREIAGMIPIGEAELYPLAYAATVLGALMPRGAGDVRSHGGEPVPAAQRRDLTIDRQRVAAKHAQVREGDYFSLLGLRRDATPHEVLRAYERMRVDFGRAAIAEEVARELEEELAEIRELVEEAYQILGDDELRAAYRESLEQP